MKRSIYFAMLWMLLSGVVYGQAKNVKETINKAFAENNIDLLESQLSSTVYLDIEDSDGNFSLNQAKVILQQFIHNNSLKSFKINHEGKSDDGAKYIIATYQSVSKSYRVYFLIGGKGKSPKILQIEIEELLD
jgi:hypothetical protein